MKLMCKIQEKVKSIEKILRDGETETIPEGCQGLPKIGNPPYKSAKPKRGDEFT